MIKKAASLLLAVFIIFLSAACSRSAAPSWKEETKEYKNDELKFRFLYPDSWVLLDENIKEDVYDVLEELDFGNVNIDDLIEQMKNSNMIYLIDKDVREDGSANNINFIINDNEAGLTLEVLKQNSDVLFEQIELLGAKITKIDKGTIKNFRSNKAFCIEYKCKFANLELGYLQAYLIGETKTCIMTFTTRGNLGEQKQIAEEILKFIRIG